MGVRVGQAAPQDAAAHDRALRLSRRVSLRRAMNAALPQSIEVGRASCRRVNARALRPIAHKLPIDSGKPANIALGRLAGAHEGARGLDDFVVRHRLHGVHCVPRFASRLLARAVIGPGRRQLSGPAGLLFRPHGTLHAIVRPQAELTLQTRGSEARQLLDNHGRGLVCAVRLDYPHTTGPRG
jgi:hypothetical protein